MPFPIRVFLLQMAENSLTRTTGNGVLDTEAMLRAIEHLGLEQPASPTSVVLEDVPEAAGALALPPPPTVSSAMPLLRWPRAAGANRPEETLPTAIDGQRGQTADSAENRGPSVPERTETSASQTSESESQPSSMMARWTALERRLEAVQANCRRVWAEEGEVLREWDSYLAETPFGRQLAGPWANRVDGLREDREVVSAARRARRERHEAEAAAALAREEIRAAERDALIARKRLKAAEEKRREVLHRAHRATVSLAPVVTARSAAPPAPPQQRVQPTQEPAQPHHEQRWDNAAASEVTPTRAREPIARGDRPTPARAAFARTCVRPSTHALRVRGRTTRIGAWLTRAVYVRVVWPCG